MSKRLSGLNPLAYIGVEAITPPQMYLAKRAPTIGDSKNFNIGDLWIDETNENLYVLVSLAAGEATWVTTFGGATTSFDTDNGTANETNGNINIVGDGVIIETTGSGDKVSIALTQATDGQLIIGNTGQGPVWANITSGDNSVIVTNGASSIGLTVDQSVVIGNGTNGQLLIGGGTNPKWASLTSDGSIIITPGVNTLQITAPNATGLTTVHTNSGDATQAAGAITLAGDGTTTTTSGTGSTATVKVKSGTNGQLLIGGGANAAWANLTSSGGTVTITNGVNTINLEAAGGGSSGASTFVTDSGNALESLGNITIAGGNNIGTSGTGQTVTINVDGTTNHSLQVGNASGSLTSLAAATNGQLPIGRTGLDPVMSTLTAGTGVTIVNGSGTITISAAGGGSSAMIVTKYSTPGGFVWNKNASTKWVSVLGWTGGGGGGSGARSFATGGTGGGCGSFFRLSGPATFFGSSENVLVGSGGAGGAGVTSGSGNNGANGTSSGFGAVIAPVTVTSNNSGLIYQQGGEGGQQFRTGGSSGGAFLMDSMSIYPMYGSPNRNVVPAGLVAGVQTATTGGDGADQGGAGTPFYPFIYGIGTAGGAGGSIQTGTPFSGGRAGNIYALDGSTVLSTGGIAGAPGVAGADGEDFNAAISDGGTGVGGGMIYGGSGGGGGGAQNGGTPAGRGGNGGFPGGGGGAGGGASSGTSGAGGNGGDGLVIVIEWT